MSQTSGAGRDRSGYVVGALLALLAVVIWHDASNLGGAVAYGVGPSVAPKLIAGGLAILGVLSILSAARTGEPSAGGFDAKAVLIICGGFLALTAIIGFGGGFIIAMAVLFATTAFAFGRRAMHIDLGLGVVLATLTYLLFSKLLTLSLPQGPLEKLLG
jgi:putative tricarboxylic transport membrane protein